LPSTAAIASRADTAAGAWALFRRKAGAREQFSRRHSTPRQRPLPLSAISSRATQRSEMNAHFAAQHAWPHALYRATSGHFTFSPFRLIRFIDTAALSQMITPRAPIYYHDAERIDGRRAAEGLR